MTNPREFLMWLVGYLTDQGKDEESQKLLEIIMDTDHTDEHNNCFVCQKSDEMEEEYFCQRCWKIERRDSRAFSLTKEEQVTIYNALALYCDNFAFSHNEQWLKVNELADRFMLAARKGKVTCHEASDNSTEAAKTQGTSQKRKESTSVDGASSEES